MKELLEQQKINKFKNVIVENQKRKVYSKGEHRYLVIKLEQPLIKPIF